MKLTLQILAALLALVVLFWAVSAILGYLVGALVIAILALGVGALLRMLLVGRDQKRAPNLSSVRRAEKDAEKMLQKLEQTTNAERKEPK